MKTILYLTYNDASGGIFSSQVVDVCNYIREITAFRVKLVSFVSLRTYFTERSKIKRIDSTAWVIPMFPGIRKWRNNGAVLRVVNYMLHPSLVIARGPFATVLALRSTGAKVCFDARGAYYSEFAEYNVSGGVISTDEIRDIECEAIIKCTSAIAVSESLVDYWKRNYGYRSQKHRVIPCTLKSDFRFLEPISVQSVKRIVFAGGNGPWQNHQAMSDVLIPAFQKDPDLQILLLMPEMPCNFKLAEMFSQRVKQAWVKENEVPALLAACDYGWLVREETETNAVASPVKFAEYLAAGLNIIISERLGDYSDFVRNYDCGIVVSINEQLPYLVKPDVADRKRIQKLAKQYFLKSAFEYQYKQLLCE